MQQSDFTEEVNRLSASIRLRAERIHAFGGPVPAIETDLALEDIRRLYDCFLQVSFGEGKVEQEPHETVEPAEHTSGQGSAETAEPIAETMDLATESEPVVEPKAVPAEPEPAPVMEVAAPVAEPLPVVTESETKQTPVASGQSNIPEIREEQPRPPTRKVLGETLKQGEMHSINDLMASRTSDLSISGRMQHNPISNLKSAIGINEKFIFVYELFGGNMQDYTGIIEKLNQMPGRNEAIALMEELRQNYHWDIENPAFQKLVDMVSRRYLEMR